MWTGGPGHGKRNKLVLRCLCVALRPCLLTTRRRSVDALRRRRFCESLTHGAPGRQGEGLEILNRQAPPPPPPPPQSHGVHRNLGMGSLGGVASLASAIGMLSTDSQPAARQPLHPLPLDAADAAASASHKRFAQQADAWAAGLASGASRLPADFAAGAAVPAWGDRNTAAEPARAPSAGDLLQRPISAQTDCGRPGGPAAAAGAGAGAPSEHKRVWTAPATGRSQAVPAGGQPSEGTLTPTKHITRQIGALDLLPKPLPAYVPQNAAAARPPFEPAAVAAQGGAMAAAAAAAGVPNDGEDAQALFGMHQSIKLALAVTSPKAEAAGTGVMPGVWVSRWVDYSKKYGLGYKLSNGCSGVFFNDATKMLLATGSPPCRARPCSSCWQPAFCRSSCWENLSAFPPRCSVCSPPCAPSRR